MRKENVDVFVTHKNSNLFNQMLAVEVKNVKLSEGVRKYKLTYRLDVFFKYFSCFLKAADLLHTLPLQVVGDQQLKVPAVVQ